MLMKLIKVYGLVLSIALGTYFGIYSKIEGLQNIGMTILWIIGILLLLSVLVPSKDTANKQRADVVNRYIRRTILFVSVLAMLYGGKIVIGVIYTLSLIVLYADSLKKRKKNEDTN